MLLGTFVLIAPMLRAQFPEPEQLNNYLILQRPHDVPQLFMLPADAIRKQAGIPALPRRPARTDEQRLHRVVREWMQHDDADERVSLLVTFAEDPSRPALPAFRRDLPPDAAENAAIARQRESRMRAFAENRAAAHRAKLNAFGADAFALKESFTAANCMHVETSVGAIQRLLHDPDVRYIEPLLSAPPPNLPQTVASGRSMMQTDFWITQFSQPSGPLPGYLAKSWLRIGLFDTGVRSTHTLLAPRIAVFRDCYNGTAFSLCTNGPNLDPTDHDGHGTGVAAIISGTANLGNDYQGVGFYYIDSYRVSTDLGLDDPIATLRAFAAAESAGESVILAEVQFDSSFDGGVAQAADIAFRQYGISVVAPIGNGTSGGFSTNAARSPGLARNVLGVGAVDIATGQHIMSYSQGPTSDGRIKPDIQAPTGAFTARNTSDTALTTAPFGGTSGAGAFAGGMVLVLWNLYNNGGWAMSDQAGRAYADAIRSGAEQGPFFNNVDGAGLVRTPGSWCQNGTGGAIGEVTFGPESNFFDINLYSMDIPAYSSWDPVTHTGNRCAVNNRVDSAIWWSEAAEDSHLQINMFLVNGSGQVVVLGNDPHSVWQKARYQTAALGSGDWHLRLVSTTIPDHEVRCYYSVHAGVWP